MEKSSSGEAPRPDWGEGLREAGAAFRFCPSCASPRIFSAEGRMWSCPDCGFEYFHNVATAAGIIIESAGSLLLLRRSGEPRAGRLALPGGFIEPGERVEDGVIRECREELGWAPARIDFLSSYPNLYRYRGIPYATCDLFFLAEATAREIAGSRTDPAEVAGLALLPLDAIPWDDIAFESSRRALREYILTWQPGRKNHG